MTEVSTRGEDWREGDEVRRRRDERAEMRRGGERGMREVKQSPVEPSTRYLRHPTDLATGDILVCLVISQKANTMLARFKVNNIVYG